MRKLVLLIAILTFFVFPVSAMEFTAPPAPESAQSYMPDTVNSFSEDLWFVIKSAVSHMLPKVAEASKICVSLIAINLLMTMLHDFSGIAKRTIGLVGVISIGILLLQPSNALIQLGVQTVEELSEYGKLLLPVMTAAMAAEGAAATSAALYTGTVAFNTVLTSGISNLIIPMIFIYMALCIATSAIEEDILKKLRDLVKWLMTWSLKIAIYVFTGYIGITGVVSGTADAAAVKAAKLAISGFVPVVGNIIADASETVLVSAKGMKSTAGVYGLIVILEMWIGPFLEIGIQYLMLKITASVCSVIGNKGPAELIENFSGVMGFLLAITGTVCLLFLISTVCLMRGIG